VTQLSQFDDSQGILGRHEDFWKQGQIAWEPLHFTSDGFRAPVSGVMVKIFQKNFRQVLMSMFGNPQDHVGVI